MTDVAITSPEQAIIAEMICTADALLRFHDSAIALPLDDFSHGVFELPYDQTEEKVTRVRSLIGRSSVGEGNVTLKVAATPEGEEFVVIQDRRVASSPSHDHQAGGATP